MISLMDMFSPQHTTTTKGSACSTLKHPIPGVKAVKTLPLDRNAYTKYILVFVKKKIVLNLRLPFNELLLFSVDVLVVIDIINIYSGY